jgi:Rhodanese-like domain
MYGDVCTAEWLHDQLQVTSSNPGLDDVSGQCGVLVLDCRSVDEYTACHVTGSLPVTVTSIMLRRLRNGSASVSAVIGGGDASRTMFIERWKSDPIVLYDNIDSCQSPPTGSVGSNSTILSTLLTRLKSDGCRVACLQGRSEVKSLR